MELVPEVSGTYKTPLLCTQEFRVTYEVPNLKFVKDRGSLQNVQY
jgi:hypothetical protein